MKVILTSNIKKLGKIGDIVNVKSGYARNFLFTNNKAIRKTEENLKDLEIRRKEIEEKKLKIQKKAEELIEKLKNISLEFYKESDENDQLYGSIQSREIISELKEKSIDIESDSIILRKQIRSIGDHEVEINPYLDLKVNIVVKVRSSNRK